VIRQGNEVEIIGTLLMRKGKRLVKPTAGGSRKGKDTLKDALKKKDQTFNSKGGPGLGA